MILEVGEIGEREEELRAESKGTTPVVRATVLHTMESPDLAEITDPSRQASPNVQKRESSPATSSQVAEYRGGVCKFGNRR